MQFSLTEMQKQRNINIMLIIQYIIMDNTDDWPPVIIVISLVITSLYYTLAITLMLLLVYSDFSTWQWQTR